MASTPEPGARRDATFRTSRILPYPAESVFQAFAWPEVLSRWWGPAGFSNTFELFEFRVGGRWKFEMHGPNGTHHPNESVFLELRSAEGLVIHHVSLPRYTLTVSLAVHEAGTAITWVQEFEDAVVAARLRHIVEPANEENLDRLVAVLATGLPYSRTGRQDLVSAAERDEARRALSVMDAPSDSRLKSRSIEAD